MGVDKIFGRGGGGYFSLGGSGGMPPPPPPPQPPLCLHPCYGIAARLCNALH